MIRGTVLDDVGWNDRVAALSAAAAAAGDAGRPARVVRVDRGLVLVTTDHGHERVPSPEPTVTGDWVVLRDDGPAGPIVSSVLPRWSTLSRRDPDPNVAREQVLVANVDVAAVVSALDRPVSQNRIERMVAAVWEGGAVPVVLLTKADRSHDLAAAIADASSAAGGADVVVTSALDGAGVDDVRALLAGGRTLALLGLSGAGKSTLVNQLVGAAVQDTGGVRARDGRGRHTTTARELVPVPGLGAVIDTPGLRTMLLWDAGEGLAASFGDVEELGAGCRFRDCRHDAEPGCAVREAVADGRLDARRFDNWQRLARELEALERRDDVRETKRAGRTMGKALRDAQRLDPRIGRRERER